MDDGSSSAGRAGFRVVPYSSGMSPDHIALLRTAGRPGAWPRGAVLLRTGEEADRTLLIERGQIKITVESDRGYTSMLAIRGPGELVGELSALDGRARSATATAMTEVLAVVITADRFLHLVRGNGALALAVLNSVVGRLRDSDRIRAEYGAQGASARIVYALLDLGAQHGSTPTQSAEARVIAVTQQELASAAGTSRESVVRALRELHREGLIETARGKVTISSTIRLEKWAYG
jgi:CRP/FNR family cyclic AMP-dependent transcriptional regulator